jgi:acyl-CoA synthetase (NDP forming)
VDLAIILVPPEAVIQAVKDCVSKGVKGIVINSAGFGEGGPEGKVRERELVHIARDGGARIIGPNCLGIYCPASKLPFPQGPSMDAGKVGIISQSGSLADHFALVATSQGIKFSKVISVGNQCDLKVNDFLEYLGADPDTEIILSYLEGIDDGKRFHELTRDISETKPIIVWKCGTSEAGARAAATHTGALAGSRHVWEGVLKGNGVISVGSFEEILDCITVFHHCTLPRGNRVAIITGPGGPAVGTTDACVRMGLDVPPVSEETEFKLNEAFPAVGTSMANPIDLSIVSAAIPHVYKDVMKILDQDDNIDMMIAIGSGGGQFYESIIETVKKVEKPVVGCVMMPLEVISEGYNQLGKNGIPFFPDPVRAANALAKFAAYSNYLRSL